MQKETINSALERRITDWNCFHQNFVMYLEENLKTKYGGETARDLLDDTPIYVCVWNCLKYAYRIWSGNMKEHDLFKIAHYAQIAWTKMKNEKVNHNDLNSLISLLKGVFDEEKNN